MTIYKVMSPIVHRESGERVPAGAFISDEGVYKIEDGLQEIVTGEAVVNVRQAPPAILWRPSYFAGRPQANINLLVGVVLDIVDASHEDYAKLVEFGVIESKKTKPSKKTEEGTE